MSLRAAGKLAEAVAAEEQSLAIEREIVGADHPESINSLRRLAILHQEMGEFTAARTLDEQALAAAMKRLGNEHPYSVAVRCELETATLLERLDPPQRQQYLQGIQSAREAQRLRVERKFSEAIAPAVKALETYRKIFGEKTSIMPPA